MIDTIQNELLKSAELTGDWERKLRMIEKGEYQLDVFKDELYKMVRELTDEVIFNSNNRHQFIKVVEEAKPKSRAKKKIDFAEIDCPKCSNNKLMKGKSAVGCSNFKECGFKLPFELMGKKLTDKQLKDLVVKKKTSKLKGFKNPSGEEFNGMLHLDDTFNVQFNQS